MISPQLRALLRCPVCTAEVGPAAPPLVETGAEGFRCPRCGREYPVAPGGGYGDLMPPSPGDLGHTSRYVADWGEFAEPLDSRGVGPPLLGAWVRNRLLRQMLALSPRDRVLELGCGNGKF